MKLISKRQPGHLTPTLHFEAPRLSKTPSSKYTSQKLPQGTAFFSELEISSNPKESLEVFRTMDNGLHKLQADLLRHLKATSRQKIEISCENIKGEELLSRRRSRKKKKGGFKVARDILSSTGAGPGRKKGRGAWGKKEKAKKRRIHSLKETKDLLGKNDLKYPRTHEWVDYSSQRYNRKKSGMLKKKYSSKQKQKKVRSAKSKTQFFSQNRRTKAPAATFLRLSPKQNRTANVTKTSLYSDVASSRNVWSRTHNLTKNIQFELIKSRTNKKRGKADYLTLRTANASQKPFDVGYSITAKNKLSEKDLLLKLDRRNFDSVDWMSDNMARLEKYSDLELFFKKRARKTSKHVGGVDKENMRVGVFKKQKPRTRDKGRPNLEVDLYSGALRKKDSNFAGKKRPEKKKEREAKGKGKPGDCDLLGSGMVQEKRVSLRKEGKKKQKKVYSSLTEILKKESLNERLSLKGIDSHYFDNIYQKLSSKIHTKKRVSRKREDTQVPAKKKTGKSKFFSKIVIKE